MIEIPLTQGRVALVDDAGARLARKRWYVQTVSDTTEYARRNTSTNGVRGYEFLHWAVLGQRVRVDHINGNGLDCRRANLRPASVEQNNANAALRCDSGSGYKGVSWHGQHEAWVARIQVGGRRQHLGIFKEVIDAAQAYDNAARAAFGRFACLNFPGPGERGCHG